MSIKSPCINICELDPASGICVGCHRTVDEITNWQKFNELEKRKIFKLIEKLSIYIKLKLIKIIFGR